MKRSNESMSYLAEPIAIVGMACRLPGGANSPSELWEMLCAQTDAITEIPEDRWQVDAFHGNGNSRTYSKWGGFVEGIDQFDASFFRVGRAEAEQMDPQQRLLLEVAWEALDAAGIPLNTSKPSNAGVFVGASTHDYGDIQYDGQELSPAGPYLATGVAQSIISNRLSYVFNLTGPSMTVDTACSSSLVALHLAVNSLRAGECGMALVGGVNCILTPNNYVAFSAMSALSHDGRCKAFDASADGFTRAEGAGVVVVKRLDDALRDGDRIYATILATGVNQDGNTSTIALPNSTAQRALIEETCAAAGVDPASVCYVEAHGTGTSVGDPAELNALGTALSCQRPPDQPLIVGSVKTNLGHLESGAGVVGLIKLALALGKGQVPPNLHFKHPNPNIPFDDLRIRVPTELEELPQLAVDENGRPRYIGGVNSFGFGGANAHAILSSFSAAGVSQEVVGSASEGEPLDVSRQRILTISAASEEALKSLADCYRRLLTGADGEGVDFATVARASACKRAHLQHRLAVGGEDVVEVAARLESWIAGEATPRVHSGQVARGVEKPLVFVFSGQGPQWWGMGRQLMHDSAVFRGVIEECDAHLRGLADWSLVEEMLADEDASRMSDTSIAQPAIFALQAGLAAVLADQGVVPMAVVGHSVGEAAAAYVAGCLTLRQGVQLMFHRGLIMSKTPPGGGMLAVGVTAEAAADAIARFEGRRLSVAAVNGAQSVTLSGEVELLEELAEEFEVAGIFNRFLKVKYAFHSPFMDAAEADLRERLAFLDPAAPKIPLYSTVTGTSVSALSLDAEYWWRNVRGTVEFFAAINALLDDGYLAFLELSAHPALVTNIRQAIGQHPKLANEAFVLPTLKRDGDDLVSIGDAVGQLYCNGTEIDWFAFFRDVADTFVDLPAYPWQHSRYWQESPINRESRLNKRSHPYLWRRISSPDPAWEVDLDPRYFAYLAHHAVNGRVVFPGAGYVEGALAMALEVLPADQPVTLEDLEFEAMLAPGSEHISKVQFRVAKRSGSFEICSRVDSPTEDGWVRHATGRMRTGGQRTAETLSALRARIDTPIDAEHIYQEFQSIGLDYGAAFRGITGAYAGDLEALCQVSLPQCPEVEADAHRYRFHPALLDSCIQSILPALYRRRTGHEALQSAFVPVEISRIAFTRAPAEASIWCHTRLTALSRSRLVANITLYDRDGKGLMAIEGLSCQVLAPARTAIKRSSPRDWTYEVAWQEWPPSAAVSREHLSLETAARVASSLDLYPLAAMAKVAAADAPMEQALSQAIAAALPISPVERGDASRAQDEEAESGTDLSQALREVVVRQLGGSDSAARADWADIVRAWPGSFPEIDIWRRLTHAFPEVVSRRDGRERLLGGGGASILEHYDTDSRTWYGVNDALARALNKVLTDLPEGRDVEILNFETHGGGLLTHCLRQQVVSAHHRVLVTSASERVVEQARRHFTRQPNAAFTRWPLTGDQADYKADVILVRDAQAVSETDWMSLVARLADGGVILAVECRHGSVLTPVLESLLNPRRARSTGFAWGDLLRRSGLDVRVFDGEAVAITLAMCAGRNQAALGTIRAEAAARHEGDGEGSKGRRWVVLQDQGALAAILAKELSSAGHSCIVQTLDDFAQSARMLGDGNSAFDDIVFPAVDCLAPLASRDRDVIGSTLSSGTALLQLLGVLADESRFPTPPALHILTAGAAAVGRSSSSQRPSQAAVAGLARVVMTELPTMKCRTLDIPLDPTPAEIEGLVLELIQPDRAGNEDEVAIRGETRYVPRVDKLDPFRRSVVVARDDPHFKTRMFSSKPGVLENLRMFRESRLAPGRGEVEIELRAAGLNFRDVMKALGIYPTDVGDENILGDECSGVVTAVGEGVDRFCVGDAVMAIAPGCFGSHVVTKETMVMSLPDAWSWSDGAATMVPYITAFYSLFVLARLRAGERVLIHAGTGGVGLAAIQLAQSLGAEVFSTAGSDAKRQFLRDFGVRHVFNSRTLDFADDIRAVTDGEGVDVVLNSLAGEAIHQGLSVLRENGRFLEIGKRDIYENSALGLRPFKKSLSYFAIDLGRMMATGETGEVLGEMAKHFESGAIRPLPYRAFPIAEATEAFRFMAEARHVGKVVLTLPEDSVWANISADREEISCDPAKTYLVTGGLKGFGFAAAQWLFDCGARKLFLVSRSGLPDGETAPRIEALRGGGADVKTLAVDVSDEGEVESCLRAMRENGPIGGIVHAATVYDDCLLLQCDESRFANVFAPKAASAWYLHELTLQDNLGFFVLFSSIAALVGNAGQGNYVAANAFLEGLAGLRDHLGLPVLVVGWDRITDTGYVARNERLGEYMDRMGFSGLSAHQGMHAMEYLLALGSSRVVVTAVDWGGWLESAGFRSQSARWERLRKSKEGERYSDDSWLQMLRDAPPEKRSEALQGALRSVIAKTLGRTENDIDPTLPMMELGLDSLSVVELIGIVENRLGTSVPAGVVAGAGNALTVESLAESILKLLQLEFVSALPASDSGKDAGAAGESSQDTHVATLIADAQLAASLSFEPASGELKGCILLTGGSGFLGAYLLHALLRRVGLPIQVLVRSGDAEEGMERLRSALRKYGLFDDVAERFEEQVVALRGDVSAEGFGLPPDQYQWLANTVTRVYHNAAVLNHLVTYGQLKGTNVAGSLEVLKFATEGIPKAVHYTSTIGVFTPNDAIAFKHSIDEEVSPQAPENLLGGYAESKWVSEMLFREARARALTVSIYRPGQLIGDPQVGICNPDDALWRFFKVATAIGVAPSIAQSTHITRVDYAAEALVEISLDPSALNGTYHLVGAPDLSLNDVFDVFASLGYGLRPVSSEEFFEALDDPKNEHLIRPLLPYLRLFPEHLADLLIEGNQSLVFDATRTLALVDADTKALLPAAPEAVRRCIAHFEEIGFLDAPRRDATQGA